MVSGHGARGGRGRCFVLWQDFMKCISDSGRISLDVCQNQREDYIECLHHRKLVSKMGVPEGVVSKRYIVLYRPSDWKRLKDKRKS